MATENFAPPLRTCTVRSESRGALIKSVGSYDHGPTMRRLENAPHNPKCTATFRTHCIMEVRGSNLERGTGYPA
jgi:hypothetical protein